ncbi:putative uncharacterized protein [Clostridium sp. CAG:492]|nr:putative uncharacterized protein [Clostridium sp. CAG:492]
MNKIKKILILICSFILDILGIFIFKDIFYAKKIIIKYAINPFDICEKQPQLWNNIKLLFIFSYIISSIIISNNIFKIIKNIKENNEKNSKKNNNYYNKNNQKNIRKNKITKNRKKLKNNINIINLDENYEKKLEICVGKIPEINEKIYIPEKGLYQNILITGTIGTGKTSSAMYPFTEQLIEYESENYDKKIGMLILDVKGNYFNQVRKFAYKYNRLDDVIVIELGGKYKYNPLNKPNLKASVLANRLKIILELFSGKTTESYWIDKSEQILCECIKFCRLYNDGYVNFEELHNLVTNQNYYIEKIEIVKKLFQKNKFSKEECYDLLTSITFFEKEFYKLDSRTMSILKSEITRITNCFISDYQVSKTFNPTQIEQNFYGLEEILSKGKIVVLNMNIAEYKNLSKIIAAYLKLDFQSEVLSRLAQNNKNKTRTVAFISDEYHEYITETDADFFAQSREAKCINIVATQSYTSLLKTLNDESILKVVIQNLINKIWFRTDDTYTIEEVQKQIGKEEKEKISKSISENAKETKYSYVTKTFKSTDSNISESISSTYEKDYVFDTKFFTQELETFVALAFLSNGNKIIKPQKLKLIPYFKKGCDDNS